MSAPGRYDYAELVAALWKLGAPGERMPTSHGILDEALKRIIDQPSFPSKLRNGLTFGDTSVGLRCFELPDILLAAQDALLTSEPNPTYLSTEVTLDEESARQIVVGLGLSTRDARDLGRDLSEAAMEIRQRSLRGDPMVAA
ncbi:MAG TPA: hypothetical protein VMI06_08595 [Terriglobia bacterium]|nr:hypothetical protein [Terriglobia bacterium]